MQLTFQWRTTTSEWTPKTSFLNLYILEASQFVQYISSLFYRFWQGDWWAPSAVLAERDFSEVKLTCMSASQNFRPRPLSLTIALLENPESNL
ncbi:MAG: hypothetical protein P8J17_10575 [Halioglobus sp.]|nr:hypothetical protein [Halioglobus sp.]